MLHKHNWVDVRDTFDYISEDGKILNYGKVFKCRHCGEEEHLGASVIYLHDVGKMKSLPLPLLGK